MFMENQNITDIDKMETTKKNSDDSIDLDPVSTHAAHPNHGGDMLGDSDGITNDENPPTSNVDPTENVDEVVQEELVEPPLRRSVRERHSSTRFIQVSKGVQYLV